MEANEKLKGKVSGAMVYPIIMTCVAVIIVGILMVKVVPSISQIFVDSGKTLPVHTRALIWMSTFVQHWWWAIIAFAIAAFAAFTAWKKTPAGRESFDGFKMRAPLMGSLVRQVAVARFSRTLGTMLSSGVPLLKALDVAKDILGNAVLRKVIDGAREQIQQGESIANTLRKSGQFPGMMCHMIAVGERSGQLETMLDNIATAYEGDADRRLTKMTAMLEPLIIVVMGGMVAFVVFSIMSPIMDMTQFGGG
jgi:general secretion pathway protein F